MSYKIFGYLPDGRDVYAYTLSNARGMQVTILNYGGIIQSMYVPTATGNRNVVLGYETLEDYLENPPYLGATIGRTAGRIEKGRLTIDNHMYDLTSKDQENLLHGGEKGFHQQYMSAKEIKLPAGSQLRLSFLSKGAEEGFPGDIEMEITYQLSECDNVLKVTYIGRSTGKNYLNMTNHSYFNLLGKSQDSIRDHQLCINASAYAQVNEAMIPSLEWTQVSGTAMDFQAFKPIDDALKSNDAQIKLAGGIDHPFLIQRGEHADGLVSAAQLQSPDKEVILEVFTTQHHLVVYTGNFLQDSVVASGKKFIRNQGICFESQEKPNMVNTHPELCKWMDQGEPYREEIEYAFYTNAH